ncbi:MAG: hypothetical protein RR923_03940 [Bacilli bacterium]
MYRLKENKKDIVLAGRKIIYCANKIRVSKEYLSSILNRKLPCSDHIAFKIVAILCNDSSPEITDYFENEE